jgi:hypothetical protein
MRPNGVLWVEVPNHDCRGFAMRGPIWFHTDAGRHMHFLTGRSLELAIRSVGLEPAATRYSGYMRQFTWLEAEQEVWRALYGDPQARPRAEAPAYPRSRSLLTHLAATVLASARRRFDSVSVLARNPPRMGRIGHEPI